MCIVNYTSTSKKIYPDLDTNRNFSKLIIQPYRNTVKRETMSFESFNSEYGEVEIAYQDGRIVVQFTEEQQESLDRAEAELIMQEYVDSLGENVEVGAAFDYVDGYWAAPVFDVH